MDLILFARELPILVCRVLISGLAARSGLMNDWLPCVRPADGSSEENHILLNLVATTHSTSLNMKTSMAFGFSQILLSQALKLTKSVKFNNFAH